MFLTLACYSFDKTNNYQATTQSDHNSALGEAIPMVIISMFMGGDI